MEYTLHFLPGRYGDSIWITYGQGEIRNHILIDGGTGGTKKQIKNKIASLPPDQKRIELLVVTHIDRDHIEGILRMLEEEALPCEIGAIWFNGWPQLPENTLIEKFGAVQGERLTAAILRHGLRWNPHFDEGPIVVPDEGQLPFIRLDGGMEITLLSPLEENLTRLKKVWDKEVTKAGLAPGFGAERPKRTAPGIEAFGGLPDVRALSGVSFEEDTAEANGSSIAFIARFQGIAVLLAGDAFPAVVSRSLERVEGDSRLALAKLSHHGSKGNTSPELMRQMDCERFVISTNGSIYHHPDAITIARLIRIKNNPEIIFNYRSKDNEIWENSELQEEFSYATLYPDGEGIIIPLVGDAL